MKEKRRKFWLPLFRNIATSSDTVEVQLQSVERSKLKTPLKKVSATAGLPEEKLMARAGIVRFDMPDGGYRSLLIRSSDKVLTTIKLEKYSGSSDLPFRWTM